MLFEMITGHIPFYGDKPIDVLLKKMQGDILSQLIREPRIHDSIRQIILLCTKIDSNERYSNIGLLKEELKRVFDGCITEKDHINSD